MNNYAAFNHALLNTRLPQKFCEVQELENIVQHLSLTEGEPTAVKGEDLFYKINHINGCELHLLLAEAESTLTRIKQRRFAFDQIIKLLNNTCTSLLVKGESSNMNTISDINFWVLHTNQQWNAIQQKVDIISDSLIILQNIVESFYREFKKSRTCKTNSSFVGGILASKILHINKIIKLSGNRLPELSPSALTFQERLTPTVKEAHKRFDSVPVSFQFDDRYAKKLYLLSPAEIPELSSLTPTVRYIMSLLLWCQFIE